MSKGSGFSDIPPPPSGEAFMVKLTPNARKNAINGWVQTDAADTKPILKCTVTAVPEDGKANEALIKLLSKYYKIPKSSIKIIQGHSARIKTLFFCD